MLIEILAAAGGSDLTGPLIIGFFILFIIIAVAALVAKLMVVGNPSEMLVISGKRSNLGEGYRTLIGRRTLVIPIIEKVARISLRISDAGRASAAFPHVRRGHWGRRRRSTISINVTVSLRNSRS